MDLTKHFKIRIARENTEKHGKTRKFTNKIFLSKSGNLGIPVMFHRIEIRGHDRPSPIVQEDHPIRAEPIHRLGLVDACSVSLKNDSLGCSPESKPRMHPPLMYFAHLLLPRMNGNALWRI